MNAARCTRRVVPRSTRTPSRIIRYAVLATLLAGCGDGAGITDPPGALAPRRALASLTPATNGKIAFASNRSGLGLYLMNPDGSGITPLAASSLALPDWSPDGSRIAFGCNGEICVINADGSGLDQLTTNAVARHPSWSGDGTKLVFESARDGNDEIYVMNADGSGQTNITNDPGSDREPAWSPDGTKIAFTHEQPGPSQIWVMNPDGTGRLQLTTTGGINDVPAWSPDGTKIVWHSTWTGSHLWVMSANGSAQTVLTTTVADLNIFPAWSPDGTKIVFARLRSGDFDLWVVNADGSAETQLTSGPAADVTPAWQPVPLDSDGDGVPNATDLCPGTPPGESVDADGCIPQQSIGLLDGQVDALLNDATLSSAQATGLTDKLAAALASIESGRTTSACGQLASFINQVSALVNSGALSPQTGAALQATASAARVQIGC